MSDAERPRRQHKSARGDQAGRRTSGAPGDDAPGVLAEVIPLVHDGLVVLRTLLDVAIQRLEELEEGRVAHVRRETYETILTVLDAEIAGLEAGESTEASEAQLEALRSLRNVIERQLRRATEGRRRPADEEAGEGNGNAAKQRRRTVTIE